MLRTGLALLTGCALCVSSIQSASAADETKPERKPGARAARTPGEGPRAAEFLKKFDKNGDGKLDDAEKAEAMKARGAGGPGGRLDPAKMQELVKKYDKDGNGSLDETERQAAKEELMKLRGGATRERPAGGKPGEGPRAAEFLKKFDKNGDGKLDDAEKAEAMKARGAAGKTRQKPADK